MIISPGLTASTLLKRDDWWSVLYQVKSRNVDFIDIMVPGLKKPLREMMEQSWPDLRKLAATLSQLDGFICGDTGPMHLASASRVNTAALIKSTRPVRFGTLRERDLSLEIKDLDVSEVAARIVQHFEL